MSKLAKMKQSFLILLLGIVAATLSAQDKVYTKSGEVLNVTVVEKSTKNVKFVFDNSENAPLIWKSNKEISKIELENGYTDYMGYQNPRKRMPIAVGVGGEFHLLQEIANVSLNLGYFVTPQIELSVNTALAVENGYNVSVGGNYHLTSLHSTSKYSPFTGLLVGYDAYLDQFVQLPLGLNYISAKGLNLSLQLNNYFFYKKQINSMSLQFKLGWRFKSL